MFITPEGFKKICFETIGKFTFISVKELSGLIGRARQTILNDMHKTLIVPMHRCRNPQFDYMEIYLYLVRIKRIELPLQ